MSESPLSSSPLMVVPHISRNRGWKRAERVSEDQSPILWREAVVSSSPSSLPIHANQGSALVPVPLDQDNDGNGNGNDKPCCVVCNLHCSRYTCPRCQVPYCSVDCYRNHISHTTKEDEAQEQASACTETFYKNRVASILRLEALEQKYNTHQVLNRQYKEQSDDKYSDHQEQHDDISSAELYELLAALEGQEDDVEAEGTSKMQLSEEQQLLALMSPALKATFQRDVQNGKLLDLILEPWYPWWRRELVANTSLIKNNKDDDNEDNNNQPTLSKTPLDERLLKVPPFSSLRNGKQASPPPELLYNLMDILYGICWTLRLYHGVNNASKLSSSCTESAATLISACSVLHQPNTCYTSLELVLTECTSASTQQYPAGCNVEWHVLAEDVALLVTSHRLAGRALLEAMDLLKAALKKLKQQSSNKKEEELEHHHKTEIQRFRQVRKKLEFFLSWSQQSTELGEDCLNEDILAWIETWKHHAEEEEETRQELERLRLPKPSDRKGSTSSGTRNKNKNQQGLPDTEPLLTAVETKRKGIAKLD